MRVLSITFLLVYFAILLYMGFRSKKVETSEEFFLAGRSISKWVLALGFLASWYGGSSCIVSADKAFKSGLGSFWVVSGPNALAPLLLMFFAAWIRRLGIISQIRVMDQRYDKTTGNFLSVIVIWYMTTWAASQMVAAGKFFSTYLNFSYEFAVITGVAIVFLYGLYGGYRVVTYTDIFQFWFLLVAMFITMVAGIMAVDGVGPMISALKQKSSSTGVQYFSLFENFSTNFMYVVSFGLGWVISADAWQRVSAARTPDDSKKMLLISGLLFIPLGILSLIVGLAGAVLYDVIPEGGVLANIATTQLHPVIAAIVFVGVGAALMSTMDTSINTGSMSITEDIYRKLINPEASNQQMVKVARIGTAIVAVIAALVALKLRNILWVLWMSSDIIMCGVFCPLIMGFIWRRGNSKGAMASMIGGSSFVFYNVLVDLGVQMPIFWPNWPYRLLYGLTIAVILYFSVSLLTSPEYEKADKFISRTRSEKKTIKEDPVADTVM
ncbi:sodium:solute symporter family protein [Desulforhopalus singaporensis]|uniref:Solute:Na+ symporter, SSS family n=1 Tax=Desulforhopalus singaporensis TaxID=91360 RepID=A0A1H0VYH7_9BACT|nr:sodium:solute symporter family protein [Desulforhopalus singaporensis]SDP83285.1 solute:Na+ symporter, SSS family [Desulforhopalus singaporensis]